MPDTALNVKVVVENMEAVKEFVATVAEVRDYCLNYDEAAGNHGDVERIGEQLEDAMLDLVRNLRRLS